MTKRFSSLTLCSAWLVVSVLATSSAEASVPRDLSRHKFSTKISEDPFATAPKLDPPSLTQQLRAIEERQAAAAECVALCEIAAGIEAQPFGVAAAEPLNRSEDAWGNYRFTSELTTSKNRFGFTGHYWDKEASLYYAKARYYDPFTARFTQADSFLGTIDDPPSLHRYFYANANPTFYTDPTGNYSWNDLKGDAGWYRDAAGAFGRDISENAGTRLGNIGRATVEQAKALPGAVVDGAQETLARVHDVGVLAYGSDGPLLSNVGQRSTDVLAGGGSLADLTQKVGIEQGKFAGELVANIYTAGGYNVAKESYLALQGTAAQAETRLNQAAGSAVLAATIGGVVKAAPVVVAEARSAIANARVAIANATESLPGRGVLNSEFYLRPAQGIGGEVIPGASLLGRVGLRAPELRPYGGRGGGHHVPAKNAFLNDPIYKENRAPAIPNDELARLKVSHSAVSGAQASLYRAFAKTGSPLTWEVLSEIETQALIRGGMKASGMAQATVEKAIQALKKAGVSGPTKIPWGG